AALGLVVRQLIGRHVVGIVDAADAKRPIGIALEEIDDHLHADARDELRTPVLAGPGLGNAHPDGIIALALPRKVHANAAVLVGVDFLARRTRDESYLRAVNERFRRRPRRPEHARFRHAGEAVGILRLEAFTADVRVV